MVKLRVKNRNEFSISSHLNKTFQKNNEMYWQSFDDFQAIPFVVVRFFNLSDLFFTDNDRNFI